METRSGIKTTEFWITALVAVLGVVTPTLVNFYGDAANFPEWAKGASVLAGSIVTVLASMGYVKSRAEVKKAELEASTRVFEAETEQEISVGEQATRAEELNVRKIENLNGNTHLGVLLLVLLLGVGCTSLLPPPYDPMTVDQIDATIKYETQDYKDTSTALEACGDAQALLEAEIRHDAEMVRLDAWKKAEEAKRVESETTDE